VALEPLLSAQVAGGVLVEGEGHLRPETLCAGLLNRLTQLGGEVRTRIEVNGVSRRGSRVLEVETTQGPIAADGFVLAAGTWSGKLAAQFGFTLPVQPGKGYSVTVSQPAAVPSRAIYLHEMRVGISPFDGAARLGGTMELSGFNNRIVPQRVEAIRRAAGRYLPGSIHGSAVVEWTGMRPLTPDGLPIIGPVPGWDNLFVATGHSMLGVTLAPVTGLAIAELVTTGSSSLDVGPFEVGRFR
jgi:D-amino-acid dehydrogenase